MQNDKAPERIYALMGKHTYEDGSRIITGYSYIMGDVEYIRADLVEAWLQRASNKVDEERASKKSLYQDIRELRKLVGLYEGEE